MTERAVWSALIANRRAKLRPPPAIGDGREPVPVSRLRAPHVDCLRPRAVTALPPEDVRPFEAWTDSGDPVAVVPATGSARPRVCAAIAASAAHAAALYAVA